MSTTGTHGENLVSINDPFNPPSDINKSTAFAKSVGNAKAGSQSDRLALSGAAIWAGLVFAETTGCLWGSLDGASWTLLNVPKFNTSGDRDAAIPAPSTGDRAYVGAILTRYNGAAWVDARTGWIPITPSAAVASSGVATINGGSVSVNAVPLTLRLEHIFDDDFPEYEIRGAVEGGAVLALSASLVVGSTVDATTNYSAERTIGSASAASAANSAGTNSWSLGSGTSRLRTTFRLRIVRPKRAVFTSLEGTNGPSSTTAGQENVHFHGQHNSTTQFDGLQLGLLATTGLLDITSIMGLKAA